MIERYNKQTAKYSYLWIALALLAIWPSAGQAAAMNTTNINEYILESTRTVLNLAVENQPILAENPDKYYQILQDYMKTWVNFTAFARGVMGASYKDATPEQITAFSNKILFTLVETYSKALLLIDPNSIGLDRGYLRKQKKQNSKRRNSKRRSVGLVARIKEGNEYPFLYSVRLEEDGCWRARNIIFSGINLGLTYRSKFASAIKDPVKGGSINKVVENWTVN